MTRRRFAAAASLVLGVATVLYAVALAVRAFPDGLSVLACLLVALFAATAGALRHRGVTQFLAIAIAALALLGAIVLILVQGHVYEDLLILAGSALCLVTARFAFRAPVHLPAATPPRKPVLFLNPRSGDGKASRFGLEEEARARGIEPVLLNPGDDLNVLVADAVARGADALAMAGGDGSQAIVASHAAEHDLPYACIPSGTRNHFALDLGVDRNDVVGALDALVDGGERRVDLADINGRVFVNNVSLGLYADAVQKDSYRDAKARTLLDMAPERLGPDAEPSELRWKGFGGDGKATTIALLVSNNRYRLGKALGSGTRPQMDAGVLGVSVLTTGDRPKITAALGPHLRQWACKTFTVEGGTRIAAGIDGEAAMLDSPLIFRTRHRALHVLIARAHPGASPSAGSPNGVLDGIKRLALITIRRNDGRIRG